MTSDGDGLFAAAVLSLARSHLPRDGGGAMRALADWLTEQLGLPRPYVCVCDTQVSGWFLVVQYRPGNKGHPFVCYYVGGQEHSLEMELGCFKELTDTRKRRDKESTFIGWLETMTRKFWEAG